MAISAAQRGLWPFALLCGAILTLLGYKSLQKDWHYLDNLRRMQDYQQIPGMLLKVDVREDSLSPGDFYPDILYDYSVNGNSVWGWRLSIEEEPKSKEYWVERITKYHLHATVPVYFDSVKPTDSVLEKKSDRWLRAWSNLGISLVFLLLGAILVIAALLTLLLANKGDKKEQES